MNEYLEKKMDALRRNYVWDVSDRLLRRSPTRSELQYKFKDTWDRAFRAAVKEVEPSVNEELSSTRVNPYSYNATVINVVDGDTLDATIDVGFKLITTLRLRLLGVNTMETDSKIPEERDMANKAKVYIRDRLLNKNVVVETHKSDVFGRYLAVVLLDGQNINKELLDKGMAVVFRE